VNLVADENVDAGIVSALRDAGHAVTYVRELDPGIDDQQVLRLAECQGALLLTSDKDFGELVFRQRLLHSGVILFRLAGLPSETKAKILVSALGTHARELPAAFTVIGPRSLRIRPGREPGTGNVCR
jgi:predicted nuclease of predicted toxin-antitoxin system